MRRRPRYLRVARALSILAWLAAVAAGVNVLWGYGSRPGPAAVAPVEFPAGSSVTLDPSRPTLCLFLHPRCPCSAATVEELNRLVSTVPGRLAVRVMFVKLAGAPSGWESSPTSAAASAIPGVSVAVDQDGREAARFGSATSGQALVYAPDGRLLFRGGLTRARGEQGRSAGRDAVTAIALTNQSPCSFSAVFGCPLFTPASAGGAQSEGRSR